MSKQQKKQTNTFPKSETFIYFADEGDGIRTAVRGNREELIAVMCEVYEKDDSVLDLVAQSVRVYFEYLKQTRDGEES